jgi:hypothetical protein
MAKKLTVANLLKQLDLEYINSPLGLRIANLVEIGRDDPPGSDATATQILDSIRDWLQGKEMPLTPKWWKDFPAHQNVDRKGVAKIAKANADAFLRNWARKVKR